MPAILQHDAKAFAQMHIGGPDWHAQMFEPTISHANTIHIGGITGASLGKLDATRLVSGRNPMQDASLQNSLLGTVNPVLLGMQVPERISPLTLVFRVTRLNSTNYSKRAEDMGWKNLVFVNFC